MDEVLSAFLGECYENLEQLDHELVLLEQEPEGDHLQASLDKIFRTVHTIKGSCGWLGLAKLESVVHDGEDLLVCLREGKLSITTDIVSTLLEMFDAIREILGHIETTEKEGNTDHAALIEKLKALQVNGTFGEAAPVPKPKANKKKSPQTKVPIEQVANTPPEPLPERFGLPQEAEALVSQLNEGPKPKKSNLGNAAKNIRVNVNLLDQLMTLVGELVLTRNQMVQLTENNPDATLSITTQRLNLITTELQEGVMKTRMQMIGGIWKKFPRLVRDLALDCGKKVNVEMEGQETELDRNIIEAIKDPLTHIVRNAVDHGLESPEERREAGKSLEGTLRLRAYHEGGHVNISITDDGRGLNLGKIREKAIEKKLITQPESETMSERAILNLIFKPGFSTAENVTHISGRGVGMDVVKSNIEEVGGSVELISRAGQGSTFKIKIPLTLAIIPALLIDCQNERFALPQMNLIELISLDMGEAKKGVEMIYNTPVYRLRGQILPLLCLKQELGLGSPFLERIENSLGEESGSNYDDFVNIIVLQADEQRFGLVVDEINDTEEIVVKPLSRHLKNLAVYAGVTILGNGKVSLILDVMGLAKKARLISEMEQRRLGMELDVSLAKQNGGQSLLLFETHNRRKMAIPISQVSRLEEMAGASIESSGELPVIQYRDHILPLVFLSSFFKGEESTVPELPEGDILNVIVSGNNGDLVGFVVDKIIDIIESEEDLSMQTSLKQVGIRGSVILNGEVVEILDFDHVATHYMPSFFEKNTSLNSSSLAGIA